MGGENALHIYPEKVKNCSSINVQDFVAKLCNILFVQKQTIKTTSSTMSWKPSWECFNVYKRNAESTDITNFNFYILKSVQLIGNVSLYISALQQKNPV